MPLVAEMLNLTNELLGKAARGGREGEAFKRAGNLSHLGINYRGCRGVLDEADECTRGEAHRKDEVLESRHGDDSGSVVKAGDRAPDAPGLVKVFTTVSISGASAPTRLFHLLSPPPNTMCLYSSISFPREKNWHYSRAYSNCKS